MTKTSLDPLMCWSQNYDRDGNVVAGLKGALNEFKEITGNQKAMYCHCASNEKKISLCKASKVLEIYNMAGVMQLRDLFFKCSAQI